MPKSVSASTFHDSMQEGAGTAKLALVAYETLLEKIVSLEFAPGMELQERHLAEILEMSRTPLREALTRLAHEGWVNIHARRSIEVKRITPKTIREVFEVREMLECRGIDIIINNDAAHAEFVNLSMIHDIMTNMQVNDFDYILTNQKFHAHLSTRGDNSLIDGLWKRVNMENVRLGILAVGVHPRRKKAVNDEHAEVITALLRRDAQTARNALLNHLGIVRANLERVLKDKI